MTEAVPLAAKAPLTNKEAQSQKVQKPELLPSMDSPVEKILFLQRTIGNQAVERLIRSGALRAKLKIGQPGDEYEQEADRVADQVMRMPEQQIPQQVDNSEQTQNNSLQRLLPSAHIEVHRRMKEDQEQKETPVQTKQDVGLTPDATSNLESYLHSSKGKGQPVSESNRGFFESRFGYDFSQVQIHTDAAADSLNRNLNARAFTTGQDIFFRQGEYSPNSSNGEKLLAHELTHLVQQNGELKAMPFDIQLPKINILQKNITEAVQRNGDPGKDILPGPIEINWGGDPLRVEFRRTIEDGGRFEFVIHYLGPHPVSGPFVENKKKHVSTMIGSADLNARVLRQTNKLIEVDLYGDGSRVIKLNDSVSFDSRPTSKGRQHDISVIVLGKSVYASSFWVLDPNAKASDIPTTQPEESPGEVPHFRYSRDYSTLETRIDGDGDQYKELQLRIIGKSFWSDATMKDAAKTVLLQIEQISTKQVREVTFDLPKPTTLGNLFPIVEEVTDGLAPTKISLILPSRTQWIEIYPPERVSTGEKYPVVAAGQRFLFQFPPEISEIHKVAAAGEASVIGYIVSTDVALGAYRDKFRFTVQPKSNDEAILGISPLYKDEPLGGVGANLKINGPVRFQAVLTSDVSLGIDLNGDKKSDLMIYDQLTTPQEVDGGGPPENNRNHRVRVVGEVIGGEQMFYFYVRNGTLMGAEGRSTVDKAAMSNAQAVSGLKQQAAEGTFEKQLDAYESAMMAERKKAADMGLIRNATYDAWAALSLAMIKLRPQINKTIDVGMQAEAARQAEALYKSLADETRHKMNVIAGEFSSTSVNPYTGEMTTVAPLYAETVGFGPELADDIKAGRWDKSFSKYQKLVSGLDQWVLDRLKEVKGEHSAQAQRVGLLTGRKRELGEIEKHNPMRILAVFHPSERFKEEQGYINEFPLSLYYWKEGNTWHLKDITNPEKTYDYTVSSVANEQEPPLKLIDELNDPDHFPVGVIHYDIPNKYGGQIRTTDYLTWKKFFTYLSLAAAAVGLTLATFGTGTVAVVGAWVLAGSALAGATSATIDLIERGQQGNLDATTAIIDIAQIVASFAGASALASGRIVQAAANAPAGARWAGNWARLAMFANKLYVPMIGTTAVADVVSFAVIAQDTAKQLDEIENGSGDRAAKDRAKALLLAQLAVMGGLTALSVKGTIPELAKGRTLVLHPGPEGIPVVTTALSKKSVVIDSNAAIALDRKAKNLPLNNAQEDAIKRIEAMGDVELRVADPTIGEVGFKGGPVIHQGIPVSVDRKGKLYQDILANLKKSSDPIGGHKLPKAESDQQIVADIFMTVTEPGVIPRFVTADPGIYNPLSRRAGYDPQAKGAGIAVPVKFGPNGFEVSIEGRTIRVIALPKVK